MDIIRFPLIALAAIAVGATPLAASAEGDHSGDTTPADTTVLTVGWFGGEASNSARIADRFAEEVDAASGGSMRVDITYDDGDAVANWQAGEYDVLLVPTRQLDAMGVHTFVPLTLPFVVQDDDQANRVGESPVIGTMEEGLSAIDATGLVVAPVWQRHLAVVGDEPLRSLDQLHTGLRRAPENDSLDPVYEAMGANPVFLNGGDWDAARADGSALAYLDSIPRMLTGESTMAANFTIYYEFTALIAHDNALARLDDVQRAIVESAAETAQQRSIDERPREADMFRDACITGATLTAMPMTLIADIGNAVDDTILDILSDSDLKRIYDRVLQAAGQRALAWPDECINGEVVRYEPPAPPSTTFPEGTYRVPGRTSEQLRVSGVSSQQAASEMADHFDATFADGVASYVRVLGDGTEAEQCAASYTVDATGLLTIEPGCGTEGTYTWHDTAGGIALEMMPTDEPLYLIQDWDDTAELFAFLMRLE